MKPGLFTTAVLTFVITSAHAGAEPAAPCSQAWYEYVETTLVSGDGQGHGPDLGSDEWKGVIEFKLEIRDQAGLPSRDSDAWCQYIDDLLRERQAFSVCHPDRGFKPVSPS